MPCPAQIFSVDISAARTEKPDRLHTASVRCISYAQPHIIIVLEAVRRQNVATFNWGGSSEHTITREPSREEVIVKICSSQLQAATRAEQQVRHPESHVCAGKTIPSAILVQLQAQVRAATRGADRKRILMGENKAGIWKRRAKQVRSSPR